MDGLRACVHCGICLPQCPTYRVLGEEMDSPRGRGYLMRAAAEDRIGLTPTMARHLDLCLGCRGCETACPSGVPYGQLLEATRATIAERHPKPLIARLVLGIFRRPLLLRVVLLGAKVIRGLGLADAMSSLPGRVGF